jgi:hypothetical protein
VPIASPFKPNLPPSPKETGYAYPVPSNPLDYPKEKPLKQPQYSSPTPKPFVDFGHAEKPAKLPSSGYDYPVPSNPLQYPSKYGAEVASVVPSGFSSATLSNGPFSAGFTQFTEAKKSEKVKPFVDIVGDSSRPKDSYSSGSFNEPKYVDNIEDVLPVYVPAGKPSAGIAPVRGGKSFKDDSSSLNAFNNGALSTNEEGLHGFPGSEENRGNIFDAEPSHSRGPVENASSIGLNKVNGGSSGTKGTNGAFSPSGANRVASPGANIHSLQANNEAFVNDKIRVNGEGQSSSGFTESVKNAGIALQGGNDAGNSGFRGNSGAFINRGNSGTSDLGVFGDNHDASENDIFGGIAGSNSVIGNGFSSNGGFGGNRLSSGNGNFANNEGSGFRGNDGFSASSGFGANNRNPSDGFRGNVGAAGNSGSIGNSGVTNNGGFGGNAGVPAKINGNGRFGGNGGAPGNVGFGGNGGVSINGGFAGNSGALSNNGVGGKNGSPDNGGFGENGASLSNSGFGRNSGPPGPSGFANNGGPNGINGLGGNFGIRGSSGSNIPFNDGNRGRAGQQSSNGGIAQADRNGKQLQDVTTFKRPVVSKPAVLGKLAGSNSGPANNWDLGLWEKFGPGGFRSFNETLGPEVCQRPGLFRHPTGE